MTGKVKMFKSKRGIVYLFVCLFCFCSALFSVLLFCLSVRLFVCRLLVGCIGWIMNSHKPVDIFIKLEL